MILDQINNARLYAGLNINFTAEHVETAEKNYIINPVANTRFAKAFEILNDKTLQKKQDGRYAFEGDDLFYTIQRYMTKPMSEGKLEAHRKYIDIQFSLNGQEIIGYTPLNELTIAGEYNPQKDIAFYNTPKDFSKVLLKPGLFCILFPDDAHLPCRQVDKPAEVRKVVIKIRL